MMWILGHALAVCIGISLGLLGGGGSVLAVPTLVYVMGVPAKEAIVLTLVAVGSVSLFGAIPHWKLGNVRLKTAAIFGSSTMIGAYTGARLATLPFVTDSIQMLLFALMMLIAASLMIVKSNRKEKAPEPETLDSYAKPVCRYCWLWLVTEGIGVGILTGLVGVGGGFAIVPALVLLAKLPMKEAIGTSLVIIALNSVAGFLGYYGRVPINLSLLFSFTLAAGMGMIAGAYLVKFVRAKQLQKMFGYFLLTVSFFVLWQNREVFKPTQSSQASHNFSHYSDRINHSSSDRKILK